MSLRSAIVDGLITDSGINSIINGRCFDRFFEFEDFLNQKPNANQFPVVTVEAETDEVEQNQDGHDNYKTASFTITTYTQVNLQKMRSRSSSVKNTQKSIIRNLDNLNSHVDNGSQDGVFETQGNRQIVSTTISLEIIYS